MYKMAFQSPTVCLDEYSGKPVKLFCTPRTTTVQCGVDCIFILEWHPRNRQLHPMSSLRPASHDPSLSDDNVGPCVKGANMSVAKIMIDIVGRQWLVVCQALTA